MVLWAFWFPHHPPPPPEWCTWSLISDFLSTRAKFISAEETTGVTFDDFAGQEYIKRELQEIVRILKNDEEFQDKGIYCPKGVLLHGPPGTGKTLLAKAIAGEAGLPFFAANGTDFVEVWTYFTFKRNSHFFCFMVLVVFCCQPLLIG